MAATSGREAGGKAASSSARRRQGYGGLAHPPAEALAKAGARERIAAAQQRAADTLAARAANEPAVAAVLTAAHRRFRFWRLCASSQCRQGRGCRGDALVCAARFWPVACSCLEEIVAAHAQGRPAADAAAQHLAQWSDEGDVLTRVQVRLVMWESTAEREGIRLPKRSGRQAV